MKKNNNKGFTLMEMLIVVAIIAVLIAIAIPTFSGSLEKSREATDMANLRAAYAQIMSDGMLEASDVSGKPQNTNEIIYDYPDDAAAAAASGAVYKATVTATQKDATKWEGGKTTVDIGGQSVSAKSSWELTYTPSTGKIEIK